MDAGSGHGFGRGRRSGFQDHDRARHQLIVGQRDMESSGAGRCGGLLRRGQRVYNSTMATCESCVPDFFQEDTLDARSEQFDWLKTHLNLDDQFFTGVLSVDQSSGGYVDNWFISSHEKTIGELWGMFLHILSATNFEDDLARRFLTAVAAPSSPLSPGVPCVPWADQSLRAFLENKGPDAIREVTAWLTSLRFTDRSASVTTCP
jgi:hypothetical protein